MSSETWKTLKFSDFLTPQTDSVTIQDETDYRQVTVMVRARGLKLRGVKRGADIGTKNQNLVHSGQWVMSKIDARNGAFGLVPASLDGAIVTNDFPIFNVDHSIVLPEFFSFFTSQPSFWAICERASRGTTNRKRLKPQIFLGMETAIPSLAEQRRIVDLIEHLDAEAKALQAKHDALGEFRNSVLHAILRAELKLGEGYDRFLVVSENPESADPDLVVA